MNSQNRLRFQKGDIFAVALVVMLAVVTVFCFLPKDDSVARVAEIYLDGERIETQDLNKEQMLSIDGNYHNTVTVSGGKVAITASD